MAKYKLLYTEGFFRALRRLPEKDVQRILRRTRLLADDPRPVGSQKLSAQEKYRIRQGNYRILYSIEDHRLVVVMVTVGHRREIYDR
jgi:mRNA interferase RelE/StbE